MTFSPVIAIFAKNIFCPNDHAYAVLKSIQQLGMVMDNDKIDNDKKCTPFAGHFNGLGNPLMQCQGHCQYGRSRATLDATGCYHQARICPVLPHWTPWLSFLV
jgi:hypothetical protein